MSVEIRALRQADAAEVRAVLLAAFPGPDEADLVERMRDRGEAILELVAEQDSKLVGYICLCALWAPRGCLGLAPVAVSPDSQRQGVGSALIEAAIADARENGMDGIFLVGDPAYYGRFGFSVEAAAKFRSAYPPHATQLLVLSPEGLKSDGDELVYASSFDDLS